MIWLDTRDMTLHQYMHLMRAQWAGEDGKPFPQVPKEIKHQCHARWSYQRAKRGN